MSEEIVRGGAFEGRGTLDFAGGTLPFEIRVEDSDWNKPKYLPTGEKQRGTSGDKLNCVTQASHNSYELQLNQMIEDKTMPASHLEWLSEKGYLDRNGKVNFSEKYNAILNLTAKYKGNWLYIVANDARKNGLIPQSMLPENTNDTWGTYYNPNQVTKEMLDMGKEFLTMFDLPYEWVDNIRVENLVKQLQQAPLQIVFANHSVVEIKSKKELMDYYDSYVPYVKEKKQSEITSYLKLLIEPIITLPEDVKIIKDANSKAVGVWFAAKNPAELVKWAEEAEIPVPYKADGGLDWAKFIQGNLTLK
ncbi:MAG: hypothetical protein KAS32_24905 [Candidatus Peribacteraceae bacterium]|nr:hypothetical protein [Candidatus Peribacteraceae bacterium]